MNTLILSKNISDIYIRVEFWIHGLKISDLQLKFTGNNSWSISDFTSNFQK